MLSDLVLRIATGRLVQAAATRLWRGGATSQGPAGRPAIAITFDDGPDPRWTPAVLDALAGGGGRATFFVVGESAEAHPDLVRRCRDEGHEVALHLHRHRRDVVASDATFDESLRRCADAVAGILGHPAALLRFPYGEKGRQDPRRLPARHGVRAVHWTFSSMDSREPDPARIVARVGACLRPGAIVLMHDRLDDDGPVGPPYIQSRAATVAAIPGILDLAKARGLSAVTVSDLLREA
jgi:peptidoglycan/xylan/chitin deacetylase (PgdA/CDA1 family)